MTLVEGLKARWDGFMEQANKNPRTYVGFIAGGMVLFSGLVTFIVVQSSGVTHYDWVSRGTMLTGAGIIGIAGFSLGCHKLHEWSSEEKDNSRAAAVWQRVQKLLIL